MRGDRFWWRTGWDDRRERFTYAWHPAIEPARTARRVAFRYRDLRNTPPPSEIQLTGKGRVFTEPRSAAGKRTVVVPELIIEDLRAHVKDFTQDGDKGLVFAGPDDGPLRNTNFNRRVWAQALMDAGLPKIHFHDLRHTGNTLAANAGASIRELMERMGHSSTRAAMIYQHSTDERQREVARSSTASPVGHWRRDRARNGHGSGRRPNEDRSPGYGSMPDLGFCVSEREWSLGDSNS
ncbi:tyrosine-type recombinase/integrase [Streptosporangium canum]|uniref:tyrosine-type recombinase/integrase n=1 Tax=Streptosporangium canum TaxID=324952 RepID=UPI003419D7FF